MTERDHEGWQTVYADQHTGEVTGRMRVPGGWLYRINDPMPLRGGTLPRAIAMTFVPDPEIV